MKTQKQYLEEILKILEQEPNDEGYPTDGEVVDEAVDYCNHALSHEVTPHEGYFVQPKYKIEQEVYVFIEQDKRIVKGQVTTCMIMKKLTTTRIDYRVDTDLDKVIRVGEEYVAADRDELIDRVVQKLKNGLIE